MRKSLFRVLGATAAFGAALLTTTAASAAPHARAGPAAGAVDAPPTTATLSVTTGTLSITALSAATLATSTGGPGDFQPGSTISGSLGAVTVTDDRALLVADWVASASQADFKTGAGSTVDTIAATFATYDPGTITPTAGTLTAGAASTPPIALANTATPVVDETGVGDNVVTWTPTEAVAVPATAVIGTYTGILQESVL